MPVASETLAYRLGIYLVADPDQVESDLTAVVDAALKCGVTAVQLRAKHLTDRELLGLSSTMATCCRHHGALFLVNDRVDIALASGADGVHLGVDDLPLATARQLLGPEAIIGYSPETDLETRIARANGADYLGVGPVFGTASKSDAGEPIGRCGLHHRVEIAQIPVIGIGGITAATAASVISTGAVGVAVVGAILRSTNPGASARDLVHAVRKATAIE